MSEEVKEKRGFKNWYSSRSKKQKIWMIVAVVATVLVIILSAVLGWLFYQPVYAVNLENVVKAENLIWSDEFEGDALDTSVWNYGGSAKSLAEDPDGNYDVGGAYHKPQAVRVEDGKLNIHIYWNEEEQQWWCGGINSMAGENHAGFMQKYGYFEIRAKLADFGGCWSTFWLLSQNYDNAPSSNAKLYGAEIDIVESPLWRQNKIQQAVHVGGWAKPYSFSIPNPRYGTKTYKKDLYSEYVTYGLYWNEDIYKFYVDGECAWTTHMSHNVSGVEEGIWLTIGTIGAPGQNNSGLKTWAGGNSLADRKKTDADYYSIDYIRVYDVYDANGNKIK